MPGPRRPRGSLRGDLAAHHPGGVYGKEFGHAILEQSLEPRPGITCKAIALQGGALDAGAAQWLAEAPPGSSPKALLPVPIFGYPGWFAGQDAAFYDDKRYFRP